MATHQYSALLPPRLSTPAIVMGVYAYSGCVYVLSAVLYPLYLFAPARPVLRHTRRNPYPCAKNPYPQRVHTRGKRVRTRCGYGYTETTRRLPVACPSTGSCPWSFFRPLSPRLSVLTRFRAPASPLRLLFIPCTGESLSAAALDWPAPMTSASD